MSEKQETPAEKAPEGKPGETATQELGTEATPSTPEKPESQEEGKVKEGSPDAAAQKELQKAQMRVKQLENEKREAELERIKQTEDDKARADRLQAELDKVEEEKQADSVRKAANEFRDKVISEFPEAVQKAAKRLIEKNPANLLWKDADDWDDAGDQLRDQLDSLKEVLGVDDDNEEGEETPPARVNANNPPPNLNGVDPNEMSVEELRKVLPKAPARD